MCWFANRLLGRPLAIGFEAVNIRLLNGILNGISLLVQIYLNLFSTMFSSDHLIGELCGPLKRFIPLKRHKVLSTRTLSVSKLNNFDRLEDF